MAIGTPALIGRMADNTAAIANTVLGASFTGSIATTVLTVTAMASGNIGPGMAVLGAGVAAGTTIVSYGTGGGQTGTYNISASQTVVSEAMTAGAAALIPAGTLVIVVAGYRSGSAISSCGPDSAGNTYSAGAVTLSNTTGVRIFSSVLANDLPQGGTITVNYAAAANQKMVIAMSVTGMSSSPFDQGATFTGTTATPSATTGTLAQADELIIGVVGMNGNSLSAEDAAFTNFATASLSSILHVAYRIVSATTAVAYAPTWGASVAAAEMVQAFKMLLPPTSMGGTLALMGV